VEEPSHLDMLKEDVRAWNEWRVQNPSTRPDLTEADLRGAFLQEADLRGANLQGADLYTAILPRANLQEADLRGGNLQGAGLIGADLRGANLQEANLFSAKLLDAQVADDHQLADTKSLQGATMPNGQKYEDWLKDKEGSGKDAETE
jgi:uncharacterized protein YjbI with pentapeptide repeats